MVTHLSIRPPDTAISYNYISVFSMATHLSIRPPDTAMPA